MGGILDPRVILIALVVAGGVVGGGTAVRETNKHVVQPVRHAIVKVIKKI